MKIIIKQLLGEEHVLDVQLSQLVLDLKARICDKVDGRPKVECQKLIFRGVTMQDTYELGHYKLEEGSKVHLYISTATSPNKEKISQKESDRFDDVDKQDKLTIDQTSITSKGHPFDEVEEIPVSQDSSRLDNNASKEELKPGTSDHNKPFDSESVESRFERLLKKKLEQHMAQKMANTIVSRMLSEIRNDLVSSSLDDLEQLAIQKLHISDQ